MKKSKKLSGIGAGIMLSACLSFLFGIYAPLELYLTNIKEFWFKITDFLPAAAAIFAVCFLGLTAALIVARLINRKFYDICLAAGGAFLIASYIQGNFLIKNLPSMSGELIDWNSYTTEIIKSAAVFVVPLAILIFVLIKFRSEILNKTVFIGSLCFTLLFAVTLTSLCVTTDTSKPVTLASTTENEFKMSKEQNFVLLVLDSVDSKCFEKLLENDDELKNSLDGFTCYENTLGAYPYTSHAVPMLFSGKWYTGEESYSQYCTDAVSGSPFLESLKKNNYSVGLYESCDLGITVDMFDGRFDNCVKSVIDYKSPFIYVLSIKMAGLKFAPWILKRYSDDISFYLAKCHNVNPGAEQFFWDGKTFYKQINESNPIITTEEKCARIIHLDGAHVPLNCDKDYNHIENGTYLDKAEACVTLIKKYVERLKESGVYDNTSIVIVADHGSDGVDYYDAYNLLKRMNPLFLVKGVGENHELKYSSAPVAYYDIAEGISKLVDKTPGGSIFDISEDEIRTRKLMIFAYEDENNIQEYTTDGRADDPDSMAATGKVYNFN